MKANKPSGSLEITKKSPLLLIVMWGIWVIILILTVPGLWRTFAGLNSIVAKVLFVPFSFCLVLFWFYGIYHFVLLIFSYLPRPALGDHARVVARQQSFTPRVAVIYTTLNDFNKEAVSTLLDQDYPNYHVFLLDVSTRSEFKARVDAIHQENPTTTTLYRLLPRQGFKARSLNDTLRDAVGPEYEFFAVCDADNYWPNDFLSCMVPYLILDKRIGFVQAKPTVTGRKQGKFASDFEVAIDASWSLHQLPRGRYGLLMCMGHSVVVRREAWERSAGYPEIVQEDTAFTMALRRHGYIGIFAPEVAVGEEFPEDFVRIRRRQYRLVQADTEIWQTQMPSFLKSHTVSLIEKIDLLARTTRLPIQAATLIYLLLAFSFIPLANHGTLSAYSIDTALGPLITPTLIIITLLVAISPFFPFFIYLKRKPLKILPLVFNGVTLHYTFLVTALASLVIYFLKGRAMFLVTGTQDGAAVQEQPVGRVRRLIQRLNADSPIVLAFDIVFGAFLLYVGIVSGGLILVSIAVVLLSALAIRRWGWHNPVISVARPLPLILIIVGLVTSLSGIIGTQSLYLALAVLSVLLF